MLYALYVVDISAVAVLPANGRPGGAVGEPGLVLEKILLITPVRQGIVSSRLVDAFTVDKIVVLAAGT